MRKLVSALGLSVGLAAGAAQAVPVSGQGTWETTLQARDMDGNPATTEAWYDTALDLLWLDAPPKILTWATQWLGPRAWMSTG